MSAFLIYEWFLKIERQNKEEAAFLIPVVVFYYYIKFKSVIILHIISYNITVIRDIWAMLKQSKQ